MIGRTSCCQPKPYGMSGGHSCFFSKPSMLSVTWVDWNINFRSTSWNDGQWKTHIMIFCSTGYLLCDVWAKNIILLTCRKPAWLAFNWPKPIPGTLSSPTSAKSSNGFWCWRPTCLRHHWQEAPAPPTWTMASTLITWSTATASRTASTRTTFSSYSIIIYWRVWKRPRYIVFTHGPSHTICLEAKLKCLIPYNIFIRLPSTTIYVKPTPRSSNRVPPHRKRDIWDVRY